MNKEKRNGILGLLLSLDWCIWILGSLTTFILIFHQHLSPIYFVVTLIAGGINVFIFSTFYSAIQEIDIIIEHNQNLQNEIDVLSDEIDKLDYRISKEITEKNS